ncbi:MAG: four helix bundle protein [Bacteroidetes bacterium]|nr:four helix bundle protein [Bacteroidota bacterium]
MTDADGEASETVVWIDFAWNCKYLDQDSHHSLITGYEEVGRMLGNMADNPEKFIPHK